MKTIKLTEQNLTNIVKRVIKENGGARIGKKYPAEDSNFEYYERKIDVMKEALINTKLKDIVSFNIDDYITDDDIESIEMDPDLDVLLSEIENIEDVIHHIMMVYND
jgi:hypothetical protein